MQIAVYDFVWGGIIVSDCFDHEMDAYESEFDAGYNGDLYSGANDWGFVDTVKGCINYHVDDGYDVEVTCTYIYDTKKALLFMYEGEEIWTAKSQLTDWDDDIEYQKGEEITIEIPSWLATKLGVD